MDMPSSTRVAVLLSSADFFASELIAEQVLPPLSAAAHAGEITILPVLLSACPYADSELKDIALLNPLAPLSAMTREQQATTWQRQALCLS